MPPSPNRDQQSGLYAENPLPMYNHQSYQPQSYQPFVEFSQYLPYAELPMLSPQSGNFMAPTNNGNGDINNTGSVFDNHIAANSATCPAPVPAPVLGYQEIAVALLKIQSSLTTQGEISALIHQSLERKVDELTKKVGDLSGKLDNSVQKVVKLTKQVDHLTGKVEDTEVELENSKESLRVLRNIQQRDSTELSHLVCKTGNIINKSINMRKYKLFQKIESIKAYHYSQETKKFEWWPYPSFPRHLRDLRNLGNLASGRWTALEQLLSIQLRRQMQVTALSGVEDLCRFYSIVIQNEIGLVRLRADTVDDHMEALGDIWGLDWKMVSNLPDENPPLQAKLAECDSAGVRQVKPRTE